LALLLKATKLTKKEIMKADIHPSYGQVIFRDLASYVEISSASHPFYTGKQRIMDSAGRVERFNERYKNFG
jgi:large subunit ribosomal protein L31